MDARQANKSRWWFLADRLGATASFLCAIHCAALPFVLAVLPLLGLSFLADHRFERGFVMFACALALTALGAAHEVLTMAWDRAERDDAHDLAGPRLPEDFALQRQHIVRMTIAATENFNQAVARYNEAITQFPALLLAWLFGFQPARGMRAALRAP